MPLLLTMHDHNLHKFVHYNMHGCSLRLTPVSYVNAATCIDMKGNLIMLLSITISQHILLSQQKHKSISQIQVQTHKGLAMLIAKVKVGRP